jgi:VAD1 Analog of StAR-related lipid transfer domain
MCDYFTVAQRIVMSSSNSNNSSTHNSNSNNSSSSSSSSAKRCRLQVGVEVVFHKSTMLRGKIKGGTTAETTGTWAAYSDAVHTAVLYQRRRLGDAVVDSGQQSDPPNDLFKLSQDGDIAVTSGATDRSQSPLVQRNTRLNALPAAGSAAHMRASKLGVNTKFDGSSSNISSRVYTAVIAVLSHPVGVKWCALLLVALVMWRQHTALQQITADTQTALRRIDELMTLLQQQSQK